MLFQSFQEQSIRTWHFLYESYGLRLPPSEETITDINLFQLQKENPYEIRTYKNPKREEGEKTGADWEWWFISGTSNLGLRIQAKKLNPFTLTYPELKKKKIATEQAEKLIKDANTSKIKFIPMYVFYNFWDTSIFKGIWKCSCETPNSFLWGCSIAYAENVLMQMIKGSPDITHMQAISHPWSCLFCCNPKKRNKALGGKIFYSITEKFSNHGENNFNIKDYVIKEAPLYVYQLMRGKEIGWENINLNKITVIKEK